MGSAQSRQQRCQQKAAPQPTAQALDGRGAGKPNRLVTLVGQGKQPAAGAAAESSHGGGTVPQAPKQATEGQAASQQANEQPVAGQRTDKWPVDEQQVPEQQRLEVHVNDEQVQCCKEPTFAWCAVTASVRQASNVH